MYIISQIFGLLALLLLIFSYQKNNRKDYLFLQLFSNIFYGLQYMFLGAFSALAANILAILRTFIFYKYDSKKMVIPLYWLIIFIILIISVGVITYSNLLSIIPIIIACLYTYGTWQKNLKLTYFIGIVVAFLWIIYNFSIEAYISTLASVFELLSSFIGLIKLKKTTN